MGASPRIRALSRDSGLTGSVWLSGSSSGGTVGLGWVGAGGSGSVGLVGSDPEGSGGSVSVGAGGSVSVGAGGSVSVGAGGSVSVGAGGSVSVGAGGSVSVGAGGWVSVGAGGWVSEGWGVVSPGASGSALESRATESSMDRHAITTSSQDVRRISLRIISASRNCDMGSVPRRLRQGRSGAFLSIQYCFFPIL